MVNPDYAEYAEEFTAPLLWPALILLGLLVSLLATVQPLLAI